MRLSKPPKQADFAVTRHAAQSVCSHGRQIRAAAPEMSRRRVFASGMRIGRDHIASTIYTIVFAYAGAALTLLLLVQFYDRPLLDLVTTEEFGSEIVRTLASAIGLVLSVPITTGIAALTLGPASLRPATPDDPQPTPSKPTPEEDQTGGLPARRAAIDANGNDQTPSTQRPD